MDFLTAGILGIIEGITEFLPVSSTGHLILASAVLKISQSEFLKSFIIAIQLGAILAVVFLYWRTLFTNIKAIKRIMLAFLPTAVLGLIFYKFIKRVLMDSNLVVLWTLILGGVFLIIFEIINRHKEENDEGSVTEISYKNSFLLGVFQSVAMIPGVSRSAATIIGGLLLGIKRKTMVEFSFLLAAPTMIAATALDMARSYQYFTFDQFEFLAIGFVASFIAAIVGVKFFINFIKNHTFIWFGAYRIIIAVIFAILI